MIPRTLQFWFVSSRIRCGDCLPSCCIHVKQHEHSRAGSCARDNVRQLRYHDVANMPALRFTGSV